MHKEHYDHDCGLVEDLLFYTQLLVALHILDSLFGFSSIED